ncbi:MAG TPA: hypothetical protein VFF69_05385 [Phycisphaerales bacterium]|nr:hypothetical protein [Phycisphaerales bacterium]
MGDGSAPHCPRCGYDLSGERDRWLRQCPLAGVCSECGLEFAWADVVSERLRPPAWSFEHARTQWMLRVARGWFASLRPGYCWSGLRLEHRIRRARLCIALVLLVGLAWVVLGVSTALMMAAESWIARPAGGGMFATRPEGWEILAVAWREYRRELFVPFLSIESPPLLIRAGPLVAAWMAALAVATAVMPLAFLLLPQTLRRTRVRRAHLLRAAAYTIPGPTILLVFGAVTIAGTRLEEFLVYAWVLTLAGVSWLLNAWRRVTRDYLRLAQSRGVWLAMSTISVLSGAIAGALLLPGEVAAYLQLSRR